MGMSSDLEVEPMGVNALEQVVSCWTMPLVPQQYDRSPWTATEKAATQLLTMSPGALSRRRICREGLATLSRLLQPLEDVFRLRYPQADAFQRDFWGPRNDLLHGMLHYDAACWQWTKDEWLGFLRKDNPLAHHSGAAYPTLTTFAYLLCDVTDLRSVGITNSAVDMARLIFGRAVIDAAVRRVQDQLVGRGKMGYRGHTQEVYVRNRLCVLFLLNRSPSLEQLTPVLLDEALDGSTRAYAVRQIAVALHRLGVLSADYRPQHSARWLAKHARREVSISEVGQEWHDWCLAWMERSDMRSRRVIFTQLLVIGRWLRANHADITTPEQWDEPLAFEFARDLRTWVPGQYAAEQLKGRDWRYREKSAPVSLDYVNRMLYYARRFFSDLQNFRHQPPTGSPRRIASRFTPQQIFRLPRRLQRKLRDWQPRDVAMEWWAKLVLTAAVLSEADIAATSRYPLSAWRALALLWTSTARRPNELLRLRKECLRREWTADMHDEQGRALPVPSWRATSSDRSDNDAGVTHGKQICYLQVPSGKSKGAFWIWIPDYVADAVDAWKQSRPEQQSRLWDDKDEEYVDFLFCTRGRRIHASFINNHLIPTLCRKAGVPERDAKGKIVGHRGRSSRATFLYRLGVSLEDLAEYLGHTDTRTIRRYAAVDPIHLHTKIEVADDLSRIVRGVLDLGAAAQGLPAIRWLIGYDADGSPTYCGNQAYFTCPHRMTCAKCGMFIGGEKARQLHSGEDTLPIESQVPMTPLELCFVRNDVAGYTTEKEKLAQIPAPEAPSTSVIFNVEGLSLKDCERLADQGTYEALTLLETLLEATLTRLKAERTSASKHSVRIKALEQKVEGIERLIVACKCRIK